MSGSYICPEIDAYLKRVGTQSFVRSLPHSMPHLTLEVRMPRDASAHACLRGAQPQLILEYLQRAAAGVAAISGRTLAAISRRTKIVLKIVFVPSPHLKILNVNRKGKNVIGRCEVNSGETIFKSAGEREIFVWRAEDWSKVVLHELLHAYGWDRLVPAKENTEHESEALVEAVAVILHCKMLAGAGPAGWRFLLRKEQMWMKQQIQELSRIEWTAPDTHVRSYYFLKYGLIGTDEAVDDLLEWLHGAPQEHPEQWSMLIRSAQKRINSITNSITKQKQEDDDGILPLRMVQHQLSLAPKLIY